MVKFQNIPNEEKVKIFRDAGEKTNLPAYAVEKDWWVVQTLSILFETEIGKHMVFKGGTSLSKAWGLIEPFSIRTFNSFLDEIYPNASFAKQPIHIPGVDPERTLLEKIFLLHEEFQRPAEIIRVDRMSRHLFDIYKLAASPFAEKVLLNQKLYTEIVYHRQMFTKLGGVDYKLHNPGTINPIPAAYIKGAFLDRIHLYIPGWEVNILLIYPDKQMSEMLFSDYLKGATDITLTDPYIRHPHQFRNLLEFCSVLIQNKKKEEEISLHVISWNEKDYIALSTVNFEEIAESLRDSGIIFTHEFQDLHDRNIIANNGWKIKLGRGLDFFEKPIFRFDISEVMQEQRQCRNCEITYLRHNIDIQKSTNK